jgi:hypothetical protein
VESRCSCGSRPFEMAAPQNFELFWSCMPLRLMEFGNISPWGLEVLPSDIDPAPFYGAAEICVLARIRCSRRSMAAIDCRTHTISFVLS